MLGAGRMQRYDSVKINLDGRWYHGNQRTLRSGDDVHAGGAADLTYPLEKWLTTTA